MNTPQTPSTARQLTSQSPPPGTLCAEPPSAQINIRARNIAWQISAALISCGFLDPEPNPSAASEADSPLDAQSSIPRKATIGRPPVLDRRRRAVVIALVTVGCSQRRAAQFLGVTEGAIRQLAQRDPAFRAALRKARACTRYDGLPLLREAGARSWRAKARCLESVFPERYNLRRRKPKVSP